MAHTFFDSIRHEFDSLVDPVLPTGQGFFDFSFEQSDLTSDGAQLVYHYKFC
jgi:hypothetical protein